MENGKYSRQDKFLIPVFAIIGVLIFIFIFWYEKHFEVGNAVINSTFIPYEEILPDCDSVKVELQYKDNNGNLLDNSSFCIRQNDDLALDSRVKDFNAYDYVGWQQVGDYNFNYIYKYNYVKQIAQDQEKMGNYGRLYVPNVGISVAINYAANNCDNLPTQQGYVNAYDSACMSNYGCESFIADHYHQGFSNITRINPGDLMYIKRNNGVVETWKCSYGGDGTNGVYDSLCFNGVSIGQQNNGGICLYTCHGNDSYNVYMRFFQKN